MSDCRTQPNLVVKHIVDNFFMFGFGSEASALLQCVKELVDEGSGMRDPQDMLRCFTTDKTTSAGGGAGAVTMTGRFGVGLSTCFLYSLERTRVPMRVMTKHREAQMAVIADFDLDAQLNPTVVQSGRMAVGVPSGTTIRIHLPINPSTRTQTLNRGTCVR
jgi:DNA topoisomerase VI subunit B